MSVSNKSDREDVKPSVSMPFDYVPIEEEVGSTEDQGLAGKDGDDENSDEASKLNPEIRSYLDLDSNRSSYKKGSHGYGRTSQVHYSEIAGEGYEEIPGEFYKSSQTENYYGEIPGESNEEITGEGYGILQHQRSRKLDASVWVTPVDLDKLKVEVSRLFQRDVMTQLVSSDLDETYGKMRGIIVDNQNVLWPTNSEFTVLRAEKKIEDYILKCWKIEPPWCYHIQFLQAMPGCYRNKFVFQVIFSIPTKEKPVPPATVSVYFTFDVDVYGGKDETVKMHYIVEGTRFAHVPGTTPFSPKWLSGVLERKTKIRSLMCSEMEKQTV